MSIVAPLEHERSQEGPLPRRDWVLLPLLSLLSMLLLLGAAEALARREFVDEEPRLAPCLILSDSSTGVRGRPNTVCRARGRESGWAEYRFNNAGHRAGMECGPRAPGAYRIVLTGSSIAMGLFVPREQSIAGLLPGQLSQRTGRNVEVYDAAIGAAYGGTPRSVDLRFAELLAARPDMILWIVSPWDMENAAWIAPNDRYRDHGVASRIKSSSSSIVKAFKLAAEAGLPAVLDRACNRLQVLESRFLVRHYLYLSRTVYLNSFTGTATESTEFLKEKSSEQWTSQLREFAQYEGGVAEKARAAGIPLVAVLVPSRAQAAMISAGEWPRGWDPYKSGADLRAIVSANGGTCVDILHDLPAVPDPEGGYMPIDGHPNVEGHAMLSRLIARELTSGAVPALRASSATQFSSIGRQ